MRCVFDSFTKTLEIFFEIFKKISSKCFLNNGSIMVSLIKFFVPIKYTVTFCVNLKMVISNP